MEKSSAAEQMKQTNRNTNMSRLFKNTTVENELVFHVVQDHNESLTANERTNKGERKIRAKIVLMYEQRLGSGITIRLKESRSNPCYANCLE